MAQAAAAASGGGTSTALALAGAASSAVPGSDVNRQYALAQAEVAMANGGVVPYSGAAALAPGAHEALLRMGRSTPYYARNAPKLCSFFARGECTRGASCPYRHEMPKDKDDPLSKQNYKDRYYGTDDPVAAKLLRRTEQRRLEGGGGSGFNPPEASDPTATTVWLGGVEGDRPSHDEIRCGSAPADAALSNLRMRCTRRISPRIPCHTHALIPRTPPCSSALYAYGDIRNVFVPPGKGCAFVDFTTHEQAKAAIAGTGGALTLGQASLRVTWAKKAGGDREARLLGSAADPRAGLTPYVPPQMQQQVQQQVQPAHTVGAADGSTQANEAPPAFAFAPPAAVMMGTHGVTIAPWAAALAGAGYAPPPHAAQGHPPPRGSGPSGAGPVRGGGGRDARAAAAAPYAHYPSMSAAQAGAPG